jgi:protein TonB
MMFVNKNVLKQEVLDRFGLGIMGAIMLHVLILVGFLFPFSQNIISAETFSAPTNITIRFTKPVKEPRKAVKFELVKPKPVLKKIAKAIPVQEITPKQLNVIEPASAPKQNPAEITRLVKEIIPVVSGDNLKGRRVQPQYPERSLRLHQEGVVWLRVLISETGARQDLKLYKPSKYALLNQAAIKAVKKWTFDPNIVNGRATRSWVEIPIEFKIQ